MSCRATLQNSPCANSCKKKKKSFEIVGFLLDFLIATRTIHETKPDTLPSSVVLLQKKVFNSCVYFSTFDASLKVWIKEI